MTSSRSEIGASALASASGDQTVRLWDLRDRAAVRPLGEPLRGHTSGVGSVAFFSMTYRILFTPVLNSFSQSSSSRSTGLWKGETAAPSSAASIADSARRVGLRPSPHPASLPIRSAQSGEARFSEVAGRFRP